MVLHNPNNWHWVNKDVSTWAQEYLEKQLVGLSAEDDGVSTKIERVMSMDGDVDVSQRKGKVITLFDVKLQLEWIGKTKEGKEASGTITVPEVAHDTEEDEYVFDIETYSDEAEKQPAKALIRSKLVPQLRTHLQKLASAIITEHAKDIQHAKDSDPSSGFSTPKYIPNTSASKQGDSSKTTTSTSQTGKGPSVNVTSLSENTEFRTTAQELYNTFTLPERLAAFTRSTPSLSSTPVKSGATFTLFGGNVSGEFGKLEEPTLITQKWRLAQWPEGHFSTLHIRFEQNDVDSVTMMRVQWDGVPIGQEEVTKRNWGEYYVRSMKTTFGFGTLL